MNATQLRSGTRRTRASGLRSLLITASATAAAVLLGISGGGVTHAFLSASAPVAQATVHAGTFGIRIGDGTTAALPEKKLTPAAPATWAFTVTNTGEAPVDLTGRIAAPGGPAYAASARGALAEVADAAACTASLAGTAALNGYTKPALGSLAPGKTKTFCLVVSLPNPSPAADSGSAHSLTLTIDAVQKGA
ncbi:hypothetical protein [Microbacterium sp.]|uniref:hypothetical protein n=1 Tax=Microbacterium sp. TaxID=51671 RepID=UPI0028ADB388|nr:hypothetical protein [Microbacterium sp.]